MLEIIKTAIQQYYEFNGTGLHIALFLFSILYLIVAKDEKDNRKLFVGYTVVFAAIYLCPITAKIIMKYCIGELVYWRMFWLLPMIIVLAYVLAKWQGKAETRIQSIGFLAAAVAVIAITGSFVYSANNFSKAENANKLPPATIHICDIIQKDAGKEEVKVLVPNELLCSIRQYNANIKMPYGRNALKGQKLGVNQQQMYDMMTNGVSNWDDLAYVLKDSQCNYFVYLSGLGTEELVANGYEKIAETDGYSIYRCNELNTTEWEVTQYGNFEGNQLMFYTIRDQKGHLTVIDGGWTDNAEEVREVIEQLGNHVDNWILTHPHSDHIGAFNEIYKDLGKITIDHIYTVQMASIELCRENAAWDEFDQYQEFLNLEISNLTYLHRRDVVDLSGLKMEVLSAYEDRIDELSNDLMNDGSMMFMLSGKERKMLFCADVGKAMSKTLLKEYGDGLKADYLQMGHHGNGGLKANFYQKVSPSIAFFDAPNWLFNDTTGTFTSMENRLLMQKLKSNIYSFETTPNRVIIK